MTRQTGSGVDIVDKLTHRLDDCERRRTTMPSNVLVAYGTTNGSGKTKAT